MQKRNGYSIQLMQSHTHSNTHINKPKDKKKQHKKIMCMEVFGAPWSCKRIFKWFDLNISRTCTRANSGGLINEIMIFIINYNIHMVFLQLVLSSDRLKKKCCTSPILKWLNVFDRCFYFAWQRKLLHFHVINYSLKPQFEANTHTHTNCNAFEIMRIIFMLRIGSTHTERVQSIIKLGMCIQLNETSSNRFERM